jgi:RHS repeat-associated protein
VGDLTAATVVRRSPLGAITTIAGTGTPGFSGDNGPATQAQISIPRVLAVDSQGYLYIDDQTNNRIRRVSPDGIITTIAGNGIAGFSGDGGPATSAELNVPAGLAIDSQGDLFIADAVNARIRKVTPDGLITTVAGNGSQQSGADGQEATSVGIGGPFTLAVDAIGDVLFGTTTSIRVVTPDGLLGTIAGGGAGVIADNGPARSGVVSLVGANGFALDPLGRLVLIDASAGGDFTLRRIERELPGLTLADILIPSEDGRQVYVFDSTGRHLHTLDALTGATLLSFGYDSAGRLISITDADNNVTTIERNSNGDPMAIVAPFGQRTTLTLDANGYLASITDPAGGQDSYAYSPDGLMQSFTDPVNNVHHFAYDSLGRLHLDQDPAGGSTTLDRTETPNGFQVTMTRAMTATQNIVSTYLVEHLPSGNEHRVIMTSGCCDSDQVIRPDGSQTVTLADGTVENITLGPDPRWGMPAPVLTSDTTTTPAGLTSVLTEQRSATLADAANPLSLRTLTDTLTQNGHSFVQTYDAASRTFTTVSAEGRREVVTVDFLGRLVSDQVGSLEPLHVSYDNRGFTTAVGQGAGATDRTLTFTPDSSGNVATITTPSSATASFGYDSAGRLSSAIVPGGQQITETYFADGSVRSITPAGQPAHTFTYTPTGLVQTYTPPNVGTGPTTVTYSYNLGGQLTEITRPDGAQLTMGYDNAGRLQTITLPNGQYTYAYDPNTENLQSATAPDGGVLAYAYDGFLPIGLTWTGTVHGQLTQSFDNNFNITSQAINNGPAVSFRYDRDGLLTQAGELTLTPDNDTGFVTSTTLAGVTTSAQPDPFGAVASASASFNGTAIYSTQYAPDADGRIHQLTETLGGTTNIFVYDYDANGQLHQVAENGTVVATYGYDANGNRTSVTTPAGTVTASVNAQDQLTQFGNITYTYAADGSLASRTLGNQVTSYSYDLLGNLTHVTLPDGTQIDYVMDGAGNRVGKKVNGTLVQGFLYDAQGRILAQLDGNNNVVSQFIYASEGTTPSYLIRGGSTYRILTDHLGSPRLIVDTATGAVAEQLNYDAFGNILQDTHPGFQPFGFAGGFYDPQTGLIRFGARDFDPETGRWTAKDPLGFAAGDTNLYRYVVNDPVNFTDPSGFGFKEWLNNLLFGPQPKPPPPKPTPATDRFLQREAGRTSGIPCEGKRTPKNNNRFRPGGGLPGTEIWFFIPLIEKALQEGQPTPRGGIPPFA